MMFTSSCCHVWSGAAVAELLIGWMRASWEKRETGVWLQLNMTPSHSVNSVFLSNLINKPSSFALCTSATKCFTSRKLLSLFWQSSIVRNNFVECHHPNHQHTSDMLVDVPVLMGQKATLITVRQTSAKPGVSKRLWSETKSNANPKQKAKLLKLFQIINCAILTPPLCP